MVDGCYSCNWGDAGARQPPAAAIAHGSLEKLWRPTSIDLNHGRCEGCTKSLSGWYWWVPCHKDLSAGKVSVRSVASPIQRRHEDEAQAGLRFGASNPLGLHELTADWSLNQWSLWDWWFILGNSFHLPDDPICQNDFLWVIPTVTHYSDIVSDIIIPPGSMYVHISYIIVRYIEIYIYTYLFIYFEFYDIHIYIYILFHDIYI